MVFIGLILVSIFLYIREYRISALIIFFFFLTSGFNLVPEEVTELTTGFSKAADYAFFILLGIITIDSIYNNRFLRNDEFTKYLFLFYGFLACCILYSKFSVGLSWSEIIRTSRYLFFWMAYYVFRKMEREELELLLKSLFTITIVLSVLYLLQIIIGSHILVEHAFSTSQIFGFEIMRFYNQPDMLNFFVFVSIFANPYKGLWKVFSQFILVTALLVAFHRSLIGSFLIALAIGYFVKLSQLKKIRILAVAFFLVLCTIVFFGKRITQSRTYIDLSTVVAGNITEVDIDIEELANSTFTFRIAHLFERITYLTENPSARIFGAGLIPEDSKKVGQLFDFEVGLLEELTGATVQLETSDISYSVLFIRLGYVGTFLNLLLFIYLGIFFYKKKNDNLGFSIFLYLILTFGVSFFSGNLLAPITFVLPLLTYNILKKKEEFNSEKTIEA